MPNTDRPKKPLKHICFADIDGTLVHFPDKLTSWGEVTQPSVLPNCFLWVERETGRRHKVLKLPPSSTGTAGMISIRTLSKLAQLRHEGAMLVLITGARTATLLQRLPFLPSADAYVAENGGRIFYPDQTLPTAMPLMEDTKWRKFHNPAAGSNLQEEMKPEDRKGTLWDFYRQLVAQGWTPDVYSYTTSFRLKAYGSKTDEDVKAAMKGIPEGLIWAFNLGHADVFPATSGKENAAKYLMDKFDAAPSSSFLLCDDDNDIGLANLLSKVFVPGFTSDSLRELAAKNPDKFVVAQKGGILGIEEVLDMVDDHLNSFVLG